MWHALSNELHHTVTRLSDERNGLINQLLEAAVQLDEPPLFIFHARCSNPLYHEAIQSEHDRKLPDALATGCGLTREEALWSTLGEAVERYACECSTYFQLETATWDEKRNQALPLEKLILYSDITLKKIRGLNPLSASEKMRWYTGFDLHTGNKAEIPAQLIWNDYQPLTKRERFSPGISTGLACGSNLVQALETGLREVVERDSFACWWLSSLPLKRIVLNDVLKSALSVGVLQCIEHPNYEVNLRWSTSDLDVPSVVCLVRSRFHEGTALGSACHLSAAVAIEKAVLEAFHTWNWMSDMKRTGVQPRPAEKIREFDEHVAYYMNDDHIQNLDSYFSEESYEIPENHLENWTDRHAALAEMLRRLRKKGYTTYAADITPVDVASFGFHIAKVFVPGLQPLHVGFGREHDDLRRLTAFTQSLGKKEWVLNRLPHCFP